MASYDVFTRAWWKEATQGGWPNGLEPYPGAPRTYIAEGVTRAEAVQLCKEFNEENDPGRYSIKAEFEKA